MSTNPPRAKKMLPTELQPGIYRIGETGVMLTVFSSGKIEWKVTADAIEERTFQDLGEITKTLSIAK